MLRAHVPVGVPELHHHTHTPAQVHARTFPQPGRAQDPPQARLTGQQRLRVRLPHPQAGTALVRAYKRIHDRTHPCCKETALRNEKAHLCYEEACLCFGKEHMHAFLKDGRRGWQGVNITASTGQRDTKA